MFSMGYRRAKSTKETLTFKKEFFGKQLRDHYPPALIAIDTNGFRRMKEEVQIYKSLPHIF